MQHKESITGRNNNMATHWKIYRGGPTPSHRNFFRVSINNAGTISLNRFALQQLGNPEAVMLMFDDQQSIIGLTASNLRNTEAFPIKANKEQTHWVIRASPFCRD